MATNGIRASRDATALGISKNNAGVSAGVGGRSAPAAAGKTRAAQKPEIFSPGAAVTGAPDLSGLGYMSYRYEPPRMERVKTPCPGRDGLFVRVVAALGFAFATAVVFLTALPAQDRAPPASLRVVTAPVASRAGVADKPAHHAAWRETGQRSRAAGSRG